MDKGEHGRLHLRLRREGKCKIPSLILQKVSHAANSRREDAREDARVYRETHREERTAHARVYHETHREENIARMRVYGMRSRISALRPDIISPVRTRV